MKTLAGFFNLGLICEMTGTPDVIRGTFVDRTVKSSTLWIHGHVVHCYLVASDGLGSCAGHNIYILQARWQFHALWQSRHAISVTQGTRYGADGLLSFRVRSCSLFAAGVQLVSTDARMPRIRMPGCSQLPGVHNRLQRCMPLLHTVYNLTICQIELSTGRT